MSDAPAAKKRRTTRTAGDTPAAPKGARTATPKAPRTSTARGSKAASKTASKAPQSVQAVPSATIAERAYERFAARGYVHGHDFEDWVLAERELVEGIRA